MAVPFINRISFKKKIRDERGWIIIRLSKGVLHKDIMYTYEGDPELVPRTCVRVLQCVQHNKDKAAPKGE
jgi:hypothetical protein